MQVPGWGASGAVDLDVDMAAPASPAEGATDGGDSSPTTQSARARKPTYIARKEEKAQLLDELEDLQRKLSGMQQAQTPQQTSLANAAPSLLEQELATSLLRDAVRTQQLSLVNVQSAVSGYVSVQDVIPHEMTISLGRDQQQRRDVLAGLKPRKLRMAIAYLVERTRFLDPFRPFAETSRFTLDCGDYSAHRMDVTPLDGAPVTVRQAYDALLAYFANMEMRVTDVLGDITTRDETDYGVDGIQQCRSVSYLSCGVHLEMNGVNNWEYMERSDEYADGGPFAVLTTDFVDQDELYPYSAHERLRQDVTAVVTIRSHTRKRLNPETGKEEEEAVVVMTRSCFIKLYCSNVVLPPLVQHQLREQLGKWGDVMVSSILEQVYARQQV